MSSIATQARDDSPRHGVKAHAQDVPRGYRRTELGVIPEDWRVCTLGDVVEFLDGQRRPVKSSDRAKMAGIYPYYGASGIVDYVNDFLFDEDLVLLGEDGENILSRNLPLAFRVSGKVWVNNHAHVLRPKSGIDIGFLTEFLESRDYSEYNSGTAQPKLNKQSCARIPIALPAPPEQRAIAEALSDVDGLLGALEALIAKKRAIKQAAMQQLLTGKTRLPGFSGEWETKRLGRHVSFLRHGTHSRADLTADDPVRNLHYGDIHTSTEVFLNARETPMPRLAVHRAAGLDRLQDGDLVLVDASEDLNGVGKSVELTGTAGIDVVSGLHTIAARFDKSVLADGFKGYLQFCPAFRQQLTRLAAGTKVYATNRAHIASVEMSLPHPDEQTAIATVLSDMNAEIAALEARRDKTRAIKQGMMQQLLTGRVRLVKPEAAANA